MKHLKLFFALFAMLALGVGNAWAEEVYFEGFEENHRTSGSNSYTATANTYGDWTLTYADAVTSGSPLTGTAHVIMRVAKKTINSPSLVSKALLSDNVSVTKVSWNCKGNAAQTLKVSYSTDGSNWVEKYSANLTTSKANKSFTLDNVPGPIYLKFVVSVAASTSSNRDANIDDITIEGTSSGSGTEEPVVKTLKSIEVTPKTINYETGDVFKFDGTCTATYSVTKNGEPQDDETAVVTPTTVSTPDMSTAGTKEITVTYTEDDVTVTDTYEINVTENVVTPGAYDITLNNVFFGTTASTNITGPVTGKKDDITITINGTGSTKPRTDATYTRFYASSTMAISVPSGYVIQSIAITKNESDYAAPSVNVGTFNTSTKTWTGNANSVTMSFSAKSFINSIKVTYALDVKSTLTIETPQNGSISVKNGTTEVTSGTQLSAGTSLVVTPTPASGYLFESLIVDGIQVELSDGKYTFTMPENDVTISATFKANEKPAATLTLSKNGETELLPGNHKQDDVVTLPDFESDCSKTFVGWSENPNCNTEPEYKAGDSYQLKLEGNQTLYAVYADGEEGGVATIKYSGSTTNMSGNNDAQTLGLDESEWTVVGEKGGASNNVGLNTNGEFRLYYHANGGNTLTITAPKTIATVVLSLKTSYDNAWVKVDGNIVEPIDGVYEINANTFVIGNANTSNVQVHILQIDVTLAGNYSNFSTTCAAAPKVEVNPTEVTATAAGGNGKVEVTSENVNTEDLRVALFNDEECGVVFTAGWLTASIDADKNITYTVAENTTYAERKAYIQLTAPDAAAATDPAVVVIPVTQAAKEKVFTSLAELLANITPTTTATKVTVTLTKEPIADIYVSGTYRNGIYLNVPYQGTTKEIEIYSRDVPAEWVVGGSVSGTLTNCDWKVYNGIWELCPADWSELTYQEPKAVSTVVVSGAPTKTTYVDGEAFDPAGLTVTVNYNDATTEVNPTGVTFTVTPTTLVKGQTSVSVTATFNSVTSEAYTVNYLIVTDIQSMTILDFITSGGTRCYLEGIVSNITNTTYGNFDLTDASGTIYVYGCLNASGEKEKFAALGVKNGDKIKVIANESSLYNGRTQTKDVQYVSHKSAATIEVADLAMKVGETQTISATVTPEGAPVTYAIKAGSDNCITLNDTEITATAAGTATIVATIAETADYMGATKEITVTVTAVDTRKKAVSPSSFTATSGELNPNDITYSASKGGGTTDPSIKNGYIQLYQIASGQSYGGFITFNAVKGCKIDQVMIVTGNTTTTHIAYSVNDVMSATTEDVQKNAEYITEAGLNAESVNIYCMHTNKDNRLFIASAIVYYTGQPLADPELSWTSNAVELRVGEAFTAPTLNNPYNVTGITYKSDNESLAKVNETTGAVTLVPDATGTATITAKFGGNDTYKAVEVSYTITVKPALVYGVWELVTDVNSLAAGDKVVIVAKDDEFALSATQGNNNRGQAAVTKNNDNTVAFGNDVQVLTLEAGTKNNTFALNTGKGYLYAASSSNNYLRTETILSDNSSWDITISADGTATIVAQGTNTRKTMQYNQTSSVFACYGSASQKALCLYMKKNVKVEGETDNTSIPNQSDVTVDNAELTVTTEAEYDNMYIGNNGSVDVKETVTVNNLYIQTTMGTTTSGQLNTTPENIIIKGDVYIDITLGDNANRQKWHAFTVPFPVDAMNGVYDLNDNQLKNEVNYAIMDYHGDIRANGQYGWKKYCGILVPGTFYLMTVDGARTTYRFKKVKDAELIAPARKELKAYTGTGDATKDKGWNGVGNPTLMHGKVRYKALILNPASYTYEAYDAEEVAFTVGTPFFIQAATDETMTMVAETSASLAPARRAAAAVENIKVMLGNSDYTDRLYVSASEDATNDYEIGKDLVKMVMTNTPIVPQIFAEAYGARLCMVNAPMTSNEATVALNLYAPAEGEYTLSVEEQAGATVYLLYNGNIVWNLSMSEYPIQLSQGDNAGYSLVVHRENAPTDVENILGADEQTEKFIYNGKLYILHEGKVFDAVGNVLK